MANLTQVLPGNRLFGAVTYEENYDPESLLISLNDNQATADAEIFTAEVPLSDAQALTETIAMLVQKALADTQASSDAKVFAVAKVLTDILGSSEAKAVAIGKTAADIVALADASTKAVSKVLDETQNLSDATTFAAQKALVEDLVSTDPLIAIHLNSVLTDFIVLQEWVSIKLIRANVWSHQTNAVVTQTLYARPLFGQRLFAASPGITWTKDNAQRRNWKNFDGENNQEA